MLITSDKVWIDETFIPATLEVEPRKNQIRSFWEKLQAHLIMEIYQLFQD